MKAILLGLLLVFSSFVTLKPESTVYVCLSPAAVAYHVDRDCRGLGKCSHKIIRTTTSEAIEKYSLRACKICSN